MRRPDSVSNVSGTCSAYFTISFAGNYVRRVSDLPSGSFPGACLPSCCPGIPAITLCTRMLNAIFPAGKPIVLQGLQAMGGGARHSVSQHRAQGVPAGLHRGTPTTSTDSVSYPGELTSVSCSPGRTHQCNWQE